MEDYPSISLYKGEDIDVLKRVISPKISIVLPLALWSNTNFKKLPGSAKLLYGIINSKLVSDNAASEPGKPAGIVFPIHRIMKLLGCSERSAYTYLKDLTDSGLVTREIVYGVKGKGMHTKLYLSPDTDTTGAAIIVIPISLFTRDEFIGLPDGAKLMYGMMFANMANDKGFTDPMGNYYQFLSAEKFLAYCILTKMTCDKYIRLLCDNGFIANVRLRAKGKRGRNIDLLYIGRLV